MKKVKDNRGFGLIEVILCITIIMILMVPIFNNFVMATKVNQKSSDKQSATTLAANIMESLYGYSQEELALQFNGVGDLYLLPNTLTMGGRSAYEYNTYINGGYGEYIKESSLLRRVDSISVPRSSVEEKSGSLVYSPVTGRYEVIYGIKDVSDSRFQYDVLITLDSNRYSDATKYNNTANNFAFPNLYELNSSSVSIIDPVGSNTIWSDETEAAIRISSDTLDEQAVSELENLHAAYIAYLENQAANVEGVTPTPTPIVIPPRLSRETIKNSITKTLSIEIAYLSESMIRIESEIRYNSNLDLNGDGEEELQATEFFKGDYTKPSTSGESHNMYVFYTPSIFNNEDVIVIKNNGYDSSIFIANQKETSTKKIEIDIEGSYLNQTKLYSNMKQEDILGGAILTSNELFHKSINKGRAYQTKVAIYPSGSIDNNDLVNPYVILESTGED